MIVVNRNETNNDIGELIKNQTNLKSFQINGLFGRYAVNMDFSESVNVYIGENGLGKTTILRCFYYVLTKNFTALCEIPFTSLAVSFKDGVTIELDKKTLVNYIDKSGKDNDNNETVHPLVKSAVMNWLRIRDIDSVASFIDGPMVLQDVVDEISFHFNVPPMAVRDYIIKLYNNRNKQIRRNYSEENKQINDFAKNVDKYVKDTVCYLPTYRRIESSALKLPFVNVENDGNSMNALMHFGMNDIKDIIDRILNIIRFRSMDGYNHMTGILLSEYSRYETVDKITKQSFLDPVIANIVLDRLGNEIDTESKEKIMNLLLNDEINDKKYLYLHNLLQKLIESYHSLEQYDKQLLGFVNTCNGYFNDKELRYDPSKLKVSLCLKSDSGKELELSGLSSGEKQIVSLFSMLYLNNLAIPKFKNRRIILLIDEPELSLSMHWQRKLLPDIMKSRNCNMLVTVTHSPFIFDNEFDVYTRELRRYLVDVEQ